MLANSPRSNIGYVGDEGILCNRQYRRNRIDGEENVRRFDNNQHNKKRRSAHVVPITTELSEQADDWSKHARTPTTSSRCTCMAQLHQSRLALGFKFPDRRYCCRRRQKPCGRFSRNKKAASRVIFGCDGKKIRQHAPCGAQRRQCCQFGCRLAVQRQQRRGQRRRRRMWTAGGKAAVFEVDIAQRLAAGIEKKERKHDETPGKPLHKKHASEKKDSPQQNGAKNAPGEDFVLQPW